MLGKFAGKNLFITGLKREVQRRAARQTPRMTRCPAPLPDGVPARMPAHAPPETGESQVPPHQGRAGGPASVTKPWRRDLVLPRALLRSCVTAPKRTPAKQASPARREDPPQAPAGPCAPSSPPSSVWVWSPRTGCASTQWPSRRAGSRDAALATLPVQGKHLVPNTPELRKQETGFTFSVTETARAFNTSRQALAQDVTVSSSCPCQPSQTGEQQCHGALPSKEQHGPGEATAAPRGTAGLVLRQRPPAPPRALPGTLPGVPDRRDPRDFMLTNICRVGVRRTGPDSFQWCPATGQGATGTN